MQCTILPIFENCYSTFFSLSCLCPPCRHSMVVSHFSGLAFLQSTRHLFHWEIQRLLDDFWRFSAHGKGPTKGGMPCRHNLLSSSRSLRGGLTHNWTAYNGFCSMTSSKDVLCRDVLCWHKSDRQYKGCPKSPLLHLFYIVQNYRIRNGLRNALVRA